MSILLKKVRIWDPQGPFHHKVQDVFLSKGRIIRIGKDLKDKADKSVQGGWVSPGWMDLNCQCGEPGRETAETFESLAKVAGAGGYTHVAILPENEPVSDTRQALEGFRSWSTGLEGYYPGFMPLGALTKGRKGMELAELYDMHLGGALAFTDGDVLLESTGMLLQALMYVKGFGGRVWFRPGLRDWMGLAQVHEGKASAHMGLNGEPGLAESLEVQKALELCRYTGGSIHFSCLTAAESVALVARAQKEKLAVTADVALQNLLLTDQDLGDFDPLKKVYPVLRTVQDQKALIKGLRDGILQAICSRHTPVDPEDKELEFTLAKPGMIALQTCFAQLSTLFDSEEDLDWILHKLCTGPRQVAGIAMGHIAEGQEVDMTIFDPKKSWTWTPEQNLSLSRNHPFFGQKLKGKVIGTLLGNRTYFNE